MGVGGDDNLRDFTHIKGECQIKIICEAKFSKVSSVESLQNWKQNRNTTREYRLEVDKPEYPRDFHSGKMKFIWIKKK